MTAYLGADEEEGDFTMRPILVGALCVAAWLIPTFTRAQETRIGGLAALLDAGFETPPPADAGADGAPSSFVAAHGGGKDPVWLPLDQTDDACWSSSQAGGVDANGDGPWVPFCNRAPARIGKLDQDLFDYCCQVKWNDACVVRTWLYSDCSCGMNLCQVSSSPLSPAQCPVVKYVCAFDPFCCKQEWDFMCAWEALFAGGSCEY